VKDLTNKPIAQIASGWNHSLALSERGDLYACGYGTHGQLGLQEDLESKIQFTLVGSLGARNVSRIFAGGNHSWFLLDDNMPVREGYRPPSPLGLPNPEQQVPQ
jgi:regulator of chromosome condensation